MTTTDPDAVAAAQAVATHLLSSRGSTFADEEIAILAKIIAEKTNVAALKDQLAKLPDKFLPQIEAKEQP